METISKYVKQGERYESLESPYMNIKSKFNNSLDVAFRKFCVALATNDALYGKKQSENASSEELKNIYQSVCKNLSEFILKLHTKEDKGHFVLLMKEISNLGEFGKNLYIDNKISAIETEISNIKNDPDYNNYIDLRGIIEYKILKSKILLDTSNFNDFDSLITDLSILHTKLVGYQKKPNYPITEIKVLEERLVETSQKIREVKKSKNGNGNYLDYLIETDNENLKDCCDELVGLLMFEDVESNVTIFDDIMIKILNAVKNNEEFESLKKFINHIKNSGELGKKLALHYLNDESLKYEEIDNIRNNIVEKNDLLRFKKLSNYVIDLVEEFEQNNDNNDVDSILNDLCEKRDTINSLNIDMDKTEVIEFLNQTIEYYESRKNSNKKKVLNI